jgi:hypothetical protein
VLSHERLLKQRHRWVRVEVGIGGLILGDPRKYLWKILANHQAFVHELQDLEVTGGLVEAGEAGGEGVALSDAVDCGQEVIRRHEVAESVELLTVGGQEQERRVAGQPEAPEELFGRVVLTGHELEGHHFVEGGLDLRLRKRFGIQPTTGSSIGAVEIQHQHGAPRLRGSQRFFEGAGEPRGSVHRGLLTTNADEDHSQGCGYGVSFHVPPPSESGGRVSVVSFQPDLGH